MISNQSATPSARPGEAKQPAGEQEFRGQTRAHYDQYPFDYVSQWPPEKIEASHPRLLRELVDGVSKQARVLEVGCSVGRFVRFAVYRGLHIWGVDLSSNSLGVLHRAEPQVPLVQADNLHLPFPDGVADVVVSDGVIMITPDARCALRENARVLRSGGTMYLAVYKRWRYYYYLYRYVGAVLRWMDRWRVSRLLMQAVCVPMYRALHNWKAGSDQAVSPEGALGLFYDYFLTPRVVFLDRSRVTSWAQAEGLEVVQYDRNPHGNCHFFVLRKTPPVKTIAS